MQNAGVGIQVYAALVLAVAAAALTMQHDRNVAYQELSSIALGALVLEGGAEPNASNARAVVAP